MFKPMLAGKFEASLQRFPVIASPKLDGIRCLGMDGQPMSRAMKILPSRHVRNLFARHDTALQGLDGELIVGDPAAHDVYRTTSSHIMSDDKPAPFTYFVFDIWFDTQGPFHQRFELTRKLAAAGPDFVKLLPHRVLMSMAELDAYEAECLDMGYEGIMLRDPNGLYKQGRSTTKSGALLKVKRYEDNEAIVIGFNEEMYNGNEAKTNELGYTKRSSHQANLVGKGTLGTFQVRGINGKWEGVEFPVGGLTDQLADEVWANRPNYLGKIITYKHFPIGTKDKPRHPVFKGFRDPMDFA